MIPRDYITEWRARAPWVDDAQVEQDLVTSRALVEIFSNQSLYNALAFRGGTPALPLTIKVEINTREHFAVRRFKEIPFEVSSRWFSGSCNIRSYELNELLGTKLRALYQRKKGRDLFDLAVALDHADADPSKIVDIFYKYMEHGGHVVTRGQFEKNIADKLKDNNFTADIGPLLGPDYSWELEAMSDKVQNALIRLLAE